MYSSGDDHNAYRTKKWGLGAGAELQRPLAIAIIGGESTGTLLTLVVIPVIYDLFDKNGRIGTNTLVILGVTVALALLAMLADLLVQRGQAQEAAGEGRSADYAGRSGDAFGLAR